MLIYVIEYLAYFEGIQEYEIKRTLEEAQKVAQRWKEDRQWVEDTEEHPDVAAAWFAAEEGGDLIVIRVKRI